MNSYERTMTALELGIPDRVPISECIIHPIVYKALVPSANYQDDFVDEFELDSVCAIAHFNVVSEDEKFFTDEWGITYKKSTEMFSYPVEGPIKSISDLEKYSLPDPDKSERLGRLPELVKKYKGEKAIIFNQRAAFTWSAYLVGYENLLMYFLTNPKFANELLDKVLEVNIKVAIKAIKTGADIIFLGDDYAYDKGLIFSPIIFKKFIKPRLKKIVDIIHKEGGKVIKHSDGNIMDIMDLLIEIGIDGLNPIDPLAGMDIGEVKKKYGDKVCLVGNIDCGHLLSFGSVNDVRNAVKACIDKAAYNGGFIIASSNSIHASVKPENYKAMIDSAKLYGNCYVERQ